MDILVIDKHVRMDAIRKIAKETYKDMAKAVVDVSKKIVAVGGELHADAEAILLDSGSKQIDLWGINIYPDKPKAERIQYTSFINIRPSHGNTAMEVKDDGVRQRIRAVVDALIGD